MEDCVEKLYFEIPSIARKEDAIDYIREFHEYQSDINGTGGLDRFIDNYEGWLEKLEQDYTRIPNEEKVPARTFFLVRDTDRRIVGMINIRLCLNERLSHYGGHMGYSIRPTERGKGYNKINLYLSANNPFVLTKYTGVDPDISAGGYSPAQDNGKLPRVRSYTLGITAFF